MVNAQPTPVTPVVAQTPQHFSATGALAQVGSALGGILLLIVAGAWAVRKLGLAPGAKRSDVLKLQASCALGQREKVVVVEIDGTWLVLGVTPHTITPLHTLSAPPAGGVVPSGPDLDFRQRLRQAIGAKGRQQ